MYIDPQNNIQNKRKSTDLRSLQHC